VNTASRLEAVNKDFNTAICIGPAAAALLGRERVAPLGTVTLRGIGRDIEVFTVADAHAAQGARPANSQSRDPVQEADVV
jgi:class 3 adenylate cyclase